MLDWLFPPQETHPPKRRPLLLPGGQCIDVLWTRHAQARRLKLSINEHGARLSLPLRASERSAEAFLFAHREWLQVQLLRLPKPDASTRLICFETSVLPLAGRTLPVDWQEARFVRVLRQDDRLSFQAPADLSLARAQTALRTFYGQEMSTAMAAGWAKHGVGFQRAPRAFKTRLLSSLWGSLSAKDEVSLDLALILGPPAALEYVLVHELCHLLHRDHSSRFWVEVERRLPDWRLQRDFLHGEGLALKAAASALLR